MNGDNFMPTPNMRTDDPIMMDLINRHGPSNIGCRPIFSSLIRAVIGQQLSEAAASTIFKRLSEITDILPNSLASLNDDDFRGCGISYQKQKYIRAICEAASDGYFDEIVRLNDDDSIAKLCKIKGIGLWTAQMVLIFSFGRPDVWPHSDAGLIRATKMLYHINNMYDFMVLGERFKPYRSHAAWYLWRSLDEK